MSSEPQLLSPQPAPPNSFTPGTVLEPDHRSGDEDEEDVISASCSLTASIVDYEFENGRRYHAYKAGHYPMPNDESELDRLDLQHHIFTLLLNGELHLAPLNPDTTQRVLDLGTGTGLWAIEMADRFPNATVTGVDLSPIQPLWVPDNVRFEIDDIESEWLWKEDHFDYIHSRIMIGSIDNWPRLIKRAFKHVKPGGWLECQDLDPELTSDDGSHKKSIWHLEFMDNLVRGARKYGKCIAAWPEFEQWFRDAGFVDVHTVLYKLPMNTWPKDKNLKEVGKYQLINYHEGYEAISIGLFTRALGWTSTEFQVLLARVRKELKDRSLHSYKVFVVCYGRKPYPHEVVDRGQSNSVPPTKQEAKSPPATRAKSEGPSHPVALSTDHASVLRPPVPPPLKVYSDAASAHDAIMGKWRQRDDEAGATRVNVTETSQADASPTAPSFRGQPNDGRARSGDSKSPPPVPLKPKYLSSNRITSPSTPSPAIPITSLLS